MQIKGERGKYDDIEKNTKKSRPPLPPIFSLFFCSFPRLFFTYFQLQELTDRFGTNGKWSKAVSERCHDATSMTERTVLLLEYRTRALQVEVSGKMEAGERKSEDERW